MAADVTTAPRPRRRWRVVLIVVLLLAIFVVGFLLRLAWLGGVFTRIKPHFAGHCRLIEGPVGPEDLTIDAPARRAYHLRLRSPRHVRRPAGAGRDLVVFARPGRCRAGQPDAGRRPLAAAARHQPVARAGRPRGAVRRQPPGAGARLAGAHHRDLRRRRRCAGAPRDADRPAPGDAQRPRRGRARPLLRHQHACARPGADAGRSRPTCSCAAPQVLHYGPGGFSTAIADLVFPNGINVSPRRPHGLRRRRHLAQRAGLRPRPGDRRAHAARLDRHRQRRRQHRGRRRRPAVDRRPSQAARRAQARRRSRESRRPRRSCASPPTARPCDEVYLSDGQPIAAASVGARFGNRLLIGQIFGNGFLDCEMEGR